MPTQKIQDNDDVLWLKDFEFNTKQVPHPTILLVAKRFSGKSLTSVSIAEKLTNIKRWAAFCGTKDTEDFWAEKFESNASIRGPTKEGMEYLVSLIKYQQRKVQKYKRLKLPWCDWYSLGLIFDDCTASKSFRQSPILEDLFSNGRHYHCTILIAAQYIKQLPPPVRTNSDYMFILHNSKRSLKILHDEYVEDPDDFGMFVDLVRGVTGQKDQNGKDLYNALVYDNISRSNKLDDSFKIYRNESEAYIEQIRLGDKQWREFNREHYKNTEIEEQLKEERKKDRIKRIEKYKLTRKDVEYDVHDDSDSDSEKEDEMATIETLKLHPRKGAPIRVNFSKQRPVDGVGGVFSGNPGISVPGISVPDIQQVSGVVSSTYHPEYQGISGSGISGMIPREQYYSDPTTRYSQYESGSQYSGSGPQYSGLGTQYYSGSRTQSPQTQYSGSATQSYVLQNSRYVPMY